MGLGKDGPVTFLHRRSPSVLLQSFYWLQNNTGETLKDRPWVCVRSCSLFSLSWSISLPDSNLPRIHNRQGCSGRVCRQEHLTEGRPYLSVTPHPASIEIPGTDSCFPGARGGLSVAEHLLCSGNSSFHFGLSSYLLTELTTQGKNKVLTGARNLLTIPFHCSRGTQITLAGRQGLAPVSSHWVGVYDQVGVLLTAAYMFWSKRDRDRER